jgi:excisionase family DNA binding protein
MGAAMSESEWLTIAEIQAERKVSRRTVYNWIEAGLTISRLSKRAVRIRRSDLERFLEERDRELRQQPQERDDSG